MMEKKTLISDTGGERIDIFLAKMLGLSRSKIAFLIKDKMVKINGKETKPHHLIKIGEKIEISLKDTTIKPENVPLDIVYEDDFLIVVNKKPGQVTHPTARIRENTLVNALLFHTSLPDSKDKDRPGIVHRLDKDTSGLIVVAKTERAQEILAKMIKERVVKRKYLGIVKGCIKEDTGEITKPIGRPKKGGVLMKVYGRSMREAKTSYKVLQRFKDASLLEIELITGRTHQIRVHFASIRHPVLGDKSYGKATSLINRQALHAFSLSFPHPITKEPLSFEVEPPPDMKDLIALLSRKGA